MSVVHLRPYLGLSLKVARILPPSIKARVGPLLPGYIYLARLDGMFIATSSVP